MTPEQKKANYLSAKARGNYARAQLTYNQTAKGKASIHRRNRKRSAITRGSAEVKLIDHLAIYERDGWVCQLCHASVDRSLAWPDRFSASLDHIIPITLGGTHVEVNVQLAHLTCNQVKGNRRIA